MRILSLLLLSASVALAAESPAPAAPDPLAPALEAYDKAVTKDLAPAYRTYEGLTQPSPTFPALKRPTSDLERTRTIDALGALPREWVDRINARGKAQEKKGKEDGVAAPVPEPLRPLESAYIAVEPTGAPVVPLDELAAQVPPGQTPESVQVPFDTLKTLAKKGAAAGKSAEYQAAMKSVENAFELKRRASLVRALTQLRSTLAPSFPPGSARGDTPWTSVASAAFRQRVDRYLAERYFKGKWLAGKSGPQSTGDGKTTAGAAGTGPDKGSPDKSGPGGTGDGKHAGPMSTTGTGKGDAPASPAPEGGSGTGTGSGAESAAPPPASGGSGTGTGGESDTPPPADR